MIIFNPLWFQHKQNELDPDCNSIWIHVKTPLMNSTNVMLPLTVAKKKWHNLYLKIFLSNQITLSVVIINFSYWNFSVVQLTKPRVILPNKFRKNSAACGLAV